MTDNDEINKKIAELERTIDILIAEGERKLSSLTRRAAIMDSLTRKEPPTPVDIEAISPKRKKPPLLAYEVITEIRELCEDGELANISGSYLARRVLKVIKEYTDD